MDLFNIQEIEYIKHLTFLSTRLISTQDRINAIRKSLSNRVTKHHGGYGQVTDHIALSVFPSLHSARALAVPSSIFPSEKPALSGISQSHSPVRALRKMSSITKLSTHLAQLPAPQIILQGACRSENIVLDSHLLQEETTQSFWFL